VLVLGGASLLVGMAWEGLSDGVRAAVLGAATLALVGAGLAIGGGPRGVRRIAAGVPSARSRVVGSLLALAAAAAGGVGAVLAHGHEGVVAGAIALAVAAAGYAAVRTTPGLVASAGASVVLTLSAMSEAGLTSSLWIGAALLGLGVAWTALALAGIAVPAPVALGVAVALATLGAQQPLGQAGAEGWAYALTAGVALACFLLYRRLRHVVVLVGGVVCVALVAPEAVWDLTDGAAGGPLILLVAGGALLAASALGLGLRRPPTARTG
jgi:hypothetical protein